MSGDRSYRVQFRYKNHGHLLRTGTLTVFEAEGQFTIMPKEGKKVETFDCSQFELFAHMPMSNTATQFDIPFVMGDSRGDLHLKFAAAVDLQVVYNRLKPLFEKAGKPAAKRPFKAKGMLQSNSPSGNSSFSKKDEWNSNHYASSPGAQLGVKRRRITSSHSNLPAFTPPLVRRNIQEDFPTTSPRIRLAVLSSSVNNDITSSLVTSPVSSRSANLMSPTVSNISTRIPLNRRIGLDSKSPTRQAVDEDELVLDDASDYKTRSPPFLPCINTRSIDSPWSFRSLANIGNSCYMNSVLQLLFYTSGVSTRLKRLMATESFCTGSEVLLSFSDLQSRMDNLKHGGQKYNSWLSIKNSLRNIREISGKCLDSEFATSRQQDAHEFWTKFIDFTNEEIKTYHKTLYGGDENDREGSQEFSLVDKSKPAVCNNLLPPGDLFKLQILSRLGCSECSNIKESQVEELYDINLDISDETRCVETVSDLVKKYMSVEVVDYACERCKNLTANKSQAMKVFPRYLLFVIKRYRYNLGSEKKKTTQINVDRDLFLNSVHVDSDEKRSEVTTLCSVMEKKSEPLCLPMSKSPLKEVMNTYHASGNGFFMDISPVQSPVKSPMKQTWLDNNNLDELDDALDLNGNNFNLCNSDEEMNSSPRSTRVNVSPRDETLMEEEGSNDNNKLDWLLENTQSVIVDEVIEASKTYFKPITESMVSRIRSELGIGRYFVNCPEWYESTFSPECELSPGEAVDAASVRADGNCLFRSLCWWLFNGDDDYQKELRAKITQFIFEFSSDFGELLKDDEQIEDHISKMSVDGEWGSHVELSAAATMFSCPIYTYHNGSWKIFRPLFAVSFDKTDSCYVKYSAIESYDIVTDGAMYLSNIDGDHFDPVRGRKFQCNMSNIEPPKPAYIYNENDGPVYTLVGVINHLGTSVNSGHYNAMTYDEPCGVWVSCDDSYINAVSESRVLEEAGRNGYMLVYKKRTVDDIMEFTHSKDYQKR